MIWFETKIDYEIPSNYFAYAKVYDLQRPNHVTPVHLVV